MPSHQMPVRELPQESEWTEHFCKERMQTYWHHAPTRETRWQPPPGFNQSLRTYVITTRRARGESELHVVADNGSAGSVEGEHASVFCMYSTPCQSLSFNDADRFRSSRDRR